MEMGMNITMIIVLLIIVSGAFKGWKMGLIQEIVSLVSLVVLVGVLLLIFSGIQSFHDKNYVQIVVIVIMLVIISFATKIGSLISKLGKSVAELPLLSLLNRSGGLVVGVAEALFFIWVGMVVMIMFENTEISQFLIAEVNENAFLHYLFDINFLKQYFM